MHATKINLAPTTLARSVYRNSSAQIHTANVIITRQRKIALLASHKI